MSKGAEATSHLTVISPSSSSGNRGQTPERIPRSTEEVEEPEGPSGLHHRWRMPLLEVHYRRLKDLLKL